MLSLPSKRFYPWNSKWQKQQIFKTNTPRIITSRIVSHLRHLYHNCFFHFIIRQLHAWDLFSVTGSNLLLSSITCWSNRSSDTHPVSPLTADSSATLRMHPAGWTHILFMQHPPLLRADWWSINSYFIIAVRVTKQTRHGRIYHLQVAYLAY